MIFGMTYSQKHRKEQERLKYLLDNPVKRFAFLPTHIHDERIVWLRTYYIHFGIGISIISNWCYRTHHDIVYIGEINKP